MAIYPATYLTNVLISDDGYTAVQVSSAIVPYNEFLTSCMATKPKLYGVNMYCQNPNQLTEPMIQVVTTIRGENDVKMIRPVPNENLLQPIGSAEYSDYVVSHGNEIKYNIQAGQTVIKEVFTGMSIDDIFIHENATLHDALGLNNNYCGGVSTVSPSDPVQEIARTAYNYDQQRQLEDEDTTLVKEMEFTLRSIANIRSDSFDVDDALKQVKGKEIKPQTDKPKEVKEYKPLPSFLFFNFLTLKMKKTQKKTTK